MHVKVLSIIINGGCKVKKTKRVVSLLLVCILAIGMTFATGCSKKESDAAGTLVVTVGDQKVYLDEIMYYIFAVEATGASYDAAYQQYYGSSYWDMEYSEGVTMRDQSKQYVMDTAIMYEILYGKAVEAGYALTDEEKTANQTKVTELLTNITEEQLKVTGFTEEVLLKTLEKVVVGEKYYNELIEGFDIDDQAITDTVNYEDYRQYDTEYLFVPTSSLDASYNKVDLSEDEKKAALDSITAALEKVNAGEEFSALAEADTKLSTDALNFVYGDTNAETAYQDAAITLENDAYSTDIVETDYGYYIIKMVNNSSTESYDEAVSAAISTAEQDAFNAEYENIKKDYATTINTEVWDTIVMGKTTLVVAATDSTTSDTSDTTDESTTDTNTSTETTAE